MSRTKQKHKVRMAGCQWDKYLRSVDFSTRVIYIWLAIANADKHQSKYEKVRIL